MSEEVQDQGREKESGNAKEKSIGNGKEKRKENAIEKKKKIVREKEKKKGIENYNREVEVEIEIDIIGVEDQHPRQKRETTKSGIIHNRISQEKISSIMNETIPRLNHIVITDIIRITKTKTK